MAPLVLRNLAQGKSSKHRSMVVAIEGVGCLLQLYSKIFVDVKIVGNPNQHLSKIGVNVPIPVFVGTGQGTSGNPAPDTHVV